MAKRIVVTPESACTGSPLDVPPPAARAEERAAPTPAGPAADRPARLLVVDDEVGLLDALCDALRDEGFEVAGFSDPAAALAAVRGGGFDLLLSDQMMPGMSGTDLLRQARRTAPGLVGVIMTGHGSSEAASEAASAGAFDLIHKPFRMRQARPTLDRALASRGELSGLEPSDRADGRVPPPNGDVAGPPP